ncbi:MAG TPA: SDR family oxidoreductase [Leptospiraceae bacterium]|nr:SDR family oxidoreductase [Leptospiraceae bacterium]HRG73386.1 SDR family oxidoreductase [Leptospiraceae bacterium]
MNSILITGGSGGIGRSIVSSLLKSYKIYNLDIKPPEKILDGETFIRVDLTSADTINSALYSVQKETLTGFVHCAGFGGPFVDITEVSEDLWDKIFAINIKAAYLLSKEILPEFKKRLYGRIIVIASSQSVVGAKNSVAYSASKHALIGFVKSLADEWGEYGITANAISPGYVETPMGVQDSQVTNHRQLILDKTPSKRTAAPEEIARVVDFLISKDLGYINGANFVIDGGITAI